MAAPDCTTANVKTITFDIGRYGELTHTITFKECVTEMQAVESVEKWLSQRLSSEDLDRLIAAGDVFSHIVIDDFTNKAAALGDATYLESIERSGDKAYLLCGS